MALGLFMPSTTGMEAQSHALGQVSTNIANMRTVGYKSNETMFYTLLGSTPTVKSHNSGISSSRADIMGVGYYDRTNILQGGEITMTGNNYDVAISGISNAFFEVVDYANNHYYTRAGDFSTQTEDGVTYLVNSGGLRVQGFASINGGDEFAVGATDIEISYPEAMPAIPTTDMTVTANVPASGVDSSSYTMTIYETAEGEQNLYMNFEKVESAPNTWKLSFAVDKGVAIGSETIVRFNSYGDVIEPRVLDVNIDWDNGGVNNIHLDISNMTQLAGDQGFTYVDQNGAPGGQFVKSFIDKDGVVKAYYSNGDTHNYAKLALVAFSSPENLVPINGTLFEANAETGQTSYIDQENAFRAQALEQSAVNVEEEFSNLLIVQRAYSMNTQSFTAANEMLELLIDLKS